MMHEFYTAGILGGDLGWVDMDVGFVLFTIDAIDEMMDMMYEKTFTRCICWLELG